MTSEFESSKVPQVEAKGTVEQRLVFVSHTHADRQLAAALNTLVDTAFSGVVKAFISSDPGPAGGIMPGDQWYSQVETNLRHSEAVWVLATPTSIERPWIYWEAGIGRALCPKGLVVLRVKLADAQVPSPLNSFQSYDGLQAAEVGSLLCKVAGQIGMNLPPVLVDACTKTWLDVAGTYEPAQEGAKTAPTLTPERLDRLDAAIARLEGLSVASRPSAPARARAAAADERRRLRADVVGDTEGLYESIAKFIEVIENAPPDTTFSVVRIDDDGDAVILATRAELTTFIYLHSSQLPLVADIPQVSERTRNLMADIATEARGHEEPHGDSEDA